ncbi:MAG: cytochrome b/b6 domain-containing protein [Hyphomonadaceae bacterium]|nr:cytochrome b/b6 domain-containing protein [Hyphomonadaceae bacterium]
MTEAAVPQQQRYTAVAIALHWTIAILIIGMIAFGWTLNSMEYGPGSPKTALVQIHKSIGITILLLSVARLTWRLMNPPPAEPPMPQWQKLLATAVHVALYVLIIAMPLTGWIMASASVAHDTRFFGTFEMTLPGFSGLPAETRKPIEDSFHGIHNTLAWVIIAMLALHIAGAVKHQFIDKDGLLARMAPGLFGRTAGPPDHGHGAIWAFGASALIFAVVAGLSLASTPAAITAPPADGGPAIARSAAPAWTVDPAQSSIAFRLTFRDRPVEGRFTKWDATIQFDPAKPQDTRVRVVIPVAQIDAGDPFFNESAVDVDWFNARQHPEAVFEINEGVFKDSETQYEATGVLTVKGVRYPVRMPFTLNITGATAKMHGEVTLKRLDLKVGAETATTKPSDDKDWVGDDVIVVIDVAATRQ